MKRSILGLGAVALALTVSASAAQAQRPVSFGVSAGAALPNGDLSEGTSMGYNLTGSVGLSMPALPVSFRVDGMWNQLSAKEDGMPGLRSLAATANVVYTLPGVAIRPYVIGGVGMYNSKLTNLPEGFTSEASNDLGINAGVGARFALSGFNTFVEARFHNLFVDGEDVNARFVPISFGIMF